MFLKKPFSFSLLAFAILLPLLLFFNLSAINHPATEFDEGVYLTTFQLVNANHPLYRETFFSQFPGFFIAVNPIFLLLGQTLQAGRIAILLWSFIGILAIIWIGYELEMISFSLIAIAALYIIPLYTDEILTFHADSLSSVFSLLAFAACLRYLKTQKKIWAVLIGFAITSALLIKLDFTIIPSLVVIALVNKAKKPLLSLGLISLAAGVIFGILFITPFGISDVLRTVIPFRVLVIAHSTFDPLLLLIFFYKQKLLTSTLILGFLLTSYCLSQKYGKPAIHIGLLAWIASALLALLLYHPIFLHHLFLLIFPSVFLFAYPLAIIGKKRHIAPSVVLTLFSFLVLALGLKTIMNLSQRQTIETNNESEAVKIVTERTNPSDFIVSDDGIINGVTRRLAPPNLVDLSSVRLQSGDLNPTSFEKSLIAYKPKLIIAWTNRINTLPNFNQILERNTYQLLLQEGEQQKIYIRTQ